MKKIILYIALFFCVAKANSQTTYISRYLKDSLIGVGVRGLFFDTSHLKDWKLISTQSGGGSGLNNYPIALSFNTGTGLLTLTRNGLSSISSSLDGRYFNQVGYGLLSTGQVVRLDSGTVFPQIRATALNQKFGDGDVSTLANRLWNGGIYSLTRKYVSGNLKTDLIENKDGLDYRIYNGALSNYYDNNYNRLYNDYRESINQVVNVSQNSIAKIDIFNAGTEPSIYYYVGGSAPGQVFYNSVLVDTSGVYITGSRAGLDLGLKVKTDGTVKLDKTNTGSSSDSVLVKNNGIIKAVTQASITSGSLTTASDLSPLFTTTETAGNINFTASNVAPYSVYGRASATGVPSFITGIDSNWVTGLHTENYYNTKYATIGGSGDMILASPQTNTGAKTFLDGTFLLRNVANTFNGQFTNTNTANRTYTLKDANGTVAFVSDLTAKEDVFTETLEEFTGSTSATVTVSNTPKTSKARMVFFNGVRMQNSNVSIATTAFTLSGITRETSDVITVKYSY